MQCKIKRRTTCQYSGSAGYASLPLIFSLRQEERKDIMKIRLLFLIVFFFILIIFPYSNVLAGKQLTEKQALDILTSQIQKDKLYDSWAPNLSCLLFFTEQRTKEYFDFGIHENHSGHCAGAGDPNTSPIVDRFRVDRLTKKIQWYEPTEGEYLPYKAVLKARLKK
jgi:hypothetical protein